jgi:hypothetical protein
MCNLLRFESVSHDISARCLVTNFMAHETRRFKATFTRAFQ